MKAALAGANQEALMKEHGEEKVHKANRAWNHVSRRITYPSILSQIWAAGSPIEGWKIFKKHYVHQADAKKSRLTQSWRSLKIKDGEPSIEYFARGSVIRSKLSSHGVMFSDEEDSRHFARNLSHVCGVRNSILLANADLSYEVFEDVELGAQTGIEMARGQEVRDGAGHALFLPGSGQGIGCAQHGGVKLPAPPQKRTLTRRRCTAWLGVPSPRTRSGFVTLWRIK